MDKLLAKSEVRKFLVDDLRGKFFTIEFIKRTTGERRVMRATTNYKSYLAGGKPKYDFIEKNTLPVLDLEKQQIRSISLDSVLIIKALGNTYEVVEDKCDICGNEAVAGLAVCALCEEYIDRH